MALRVQGLAQSQSLLGALPDAAQAQLRERIAEIARDVLAAQRQDAPKRTGALAAGLSAQLDGLRARVGLIGIKAKSRSAIRAARREGRAVGRNYGNLYYGRFVEFGRAAQTVLVERKGARPYSMKVSALPARPFVKVERPSAEQRLANFWSETLNAAERIA